MTATRPRNFGEWTGPWRLEDISVYTPGLNGEPGEETSFTAWVREYREDYWCGRDGCCSTTWPFMGPKVDSGS